MEQNEIEAHKLYAKLKKASISARIEGGGVQWSVEATSNSGRSLSVASRLDPQLTWEIEGNPAYDPWVYGVQIWRQFI